MTRVLLAAMALAAFPLGFARGEEAVVHLTVRPMPAPKPALKYQLLPELRELNPGNAAQNYLKCFMEQRSFFFTKESAAERARYQTMPLAELPVETSCSTTAASRSRRRTGRPGWIHSTGRRSSASRTAAWIRCPAELGPLQDPGGGTPGPVPCRGGRAALRRRDPYRQDDVRAGPPPGRAPH